MKKITISFVLARFVFFSGLALALLISALVSNQVMNVINSEQDKVILREINQINDSYQIFLNNRLTLLKEHSNFPIMIQTLMQPESNKGNIFDFMAGLSILGKKYRMSLLDFEGQLIHSTDPSIKINYQDTPWVKWVLNRTQTDRDSLTKTSIIKVNNQYHFSISVAIAYNGSIEGILTSEIPINDINEGINSELRLQGVSIEIIQNEEVLITFGNKIDGEKKSIYWPELNISLRFSLDKSIINSSLYSLMIQISLIIISAIFITSFLAYQYGYRYFVKPLLSLSQAAEKLDKGDHYQALHEESKIKELSSLFLQFNHMVDQVQKRETDLKNSYAKLAQANDELKLSESQLVQSEKMASIGLLAAGVAHEINNPIGYVKSNLNVLNDYIDNLKEYEQAVTEDLILNEHVNLAYQQRKQVLLEKHDITYLFQDIFPLIKSTIGGIDRVDEIVQSLKVFAREELPDKSLVDINEGLNATLKIVWNELKYNCEIHVDLAKLPMTLAYPSKLNQVFMNLLINAGQSIEEKGDIFVRTRVKDKNIIIEIEDTGCGIAQETLTQIFTPFYTSKPVGAGTGLGLSISHNIVKQHNGDISVISNINKGSCFSVAIPIIESE
ncbi:two-component sensor histidine kinase [Pseudoalteromonas sp. NBT06-2]|uniref:sensor histidine kinase n=1 Tax=Pseudoalteromonas sp. NBT06-2 TaxID=2025950 RepID=UPI000BA52294|nr:ATP-binding protein [Pseudoalteromonas sp. NBT06-2]PAJ75486.1 two-component sensor histidine kinase [Pseudoalteromonas sp. NBT06-2]